MTLEVMPDGFTGGWLAQNQAPDGFTRLCIRAGDLTICSGGK
jgi:hypothetical protein